MGEKSDILRYEILYQYGGLYVDTDFECIQPFDLFHQVCDFYVGLEANFFDDSEAAIGNALIGSTPLHPILKHCLEFIAKREPGKNADEVQSVSGPGCLRKAFFRGCKEGAERNIAFPFGYFYPLPAQERDGLGHQEKWIQPETFAIHYWNTIGFQLLIFEREKEFYDWLC